MVLPVAVAVVSHPEVVVVSVLLVAVVVASVLPVEEVALADSRAEVVPVVSVAVAVLLAAVAEEATKCVDNKRRKMAQWAGAIHGSGVSALTTAAICVRG